MSASIASTTSPAGGPSPFAGLEVIELADDPAGEFTGSLLARMGARVTKLEPPRGAASRHSGPFAGSRPDPEASLAFWYYNSNKRSVRLDLDAEGAVHAIQSHTDGASLFLTTLQPHALEKIGLDLDALITRNPGLIVLSVTPFGLTGPWANYKSSDLVGLALGGPLNCCGYDDHSIPPIRPGGGQAFHSAASFAYLGALVALLQRQQDGRGQLVDISMHESCAVNVEFANPYWIYTQTLVHRQTCRHAQPSPTQSQLFQSSDNRYVYLTLILADQYQWRALTKWMDSQGFALDLVEEQYLDRNFRRENYAYIYDLITCFFLTKPALESFHEGQKVGLPIAVVSAPEEILVDDNLAARDFFVQVDCGEWGSVPFPGPIYRSSSFGEVQRLRAPRLGEHE